MTEETPLKHISTFLSFCHDFQKKKCYKRYFWQAKFKLKSWLTSSNMPLLWRFLMCLRLPVSWVFFHFYWECIVITVHLSYGAMWFFSCSCKLLRLYLQNFVLLMILISITALYVTNLVTDGLAHQKKMV